MNNLQLIITTAIITTAGFFISCDFISDKMATEYVSEREVGISRAEVRVEIQEFRIEMSEIIMENNRSIADIKRKINRGERWSVADIIRKVNRGDNSVRVNQEARIMKLKSENQEMNRVLNNYSDLNRHHWETFKKDYRDDIEALGKSFENFFEKSDVTITTTKSQ